MTSHPARGSGVGLGFCLVALFLLPLAWSTSSLKVRFTEHPEYVVALPGDSVFFHCRTNSDKADQNIRWLHNDTLIPSKHPSFINSAGTTLSLELSRDRTSVTSQLGEYRCLSGIDDQYAASLSARLSVAKLDDFFGAARPKTIEAVEGNNVVIECNIPASNPPAFVQFYKDNQVIELAESHEPSQGHRKLLNGELLLLTNVTSVDGGRFTCSASNHITNQKKMSPTYTLLTVRPRTEAAKPRLTFWPKESYTVSTGDSLIIPCVASGNPSPEIVWTKVGDPKKLELARNGFLEIRQADATDSGAYLCSIFNGSRRFLRKTTVTVQVLPVFLRVPVLQKNPVKEGARLQLHCQAEGTPPPKIKWFLNGLPVIKGHKRVMSNGTLVVPFVRREDSGVYQCFIENSVGSNVSAVVLDVLSDDSITDEELDMWHQQEYLDHMTTVPPSKPEVVQNSRNSVLLTWDVPLNDSLRGEAMPVQFFKVQFREFHNGRRSEWRTLDETINARSRSFEVMGLRDDVRYRFRIVAVFINNDNKAGPLSDRFKLDMKEGRRDDVPPDSAPVITDVLPLGERSLRVGWRMDRGVRLVEGYFIHIRPGFKKITIIGRASHSFTFDNLQPGTMYEISVEAFNFYGTSPSSKAVRQKTLSAHPPMNGPEVNTTEVNSFEPLNELEREGVVGTNGRIAFYLILSGVVVGAVFVLVACCHMASYVRKKKARKAFANGKAAIHQKYLDTSRQISSGDLRHHLPGVVGPRTGPYQASDQQIYVSTSQTAETSFSSPNRMSQLLGTFNNDGLLRGANNGGPVDSSSTSDLNQSRNSPCLPVLDNDVGVDLEVEVQEYTDEPSILSWKRRRKSEDDL